MSHPKVLPVSTVWSHGESLFRSAHELLRNKLIFQVIDCLAGEKRSNYFHLMFLGNLNCFCCVARETASIMAHSRTVSHTLAWINAAQILENWILPGKLQPSPTQRTDAEGPLNSMAVYTQLVWSCSCKLMKYHPIAREHFAGPSATVWIFPSLFSHVPGLMPSRCAAARSQAWAWTEDSSMDFSGTPLALSLLFQLANQFLTKPWAWWFFGVLYSKSFSAFLFELLWFCCLFFHIACGLRIMLQPAALLLKLLP